MNQERERDWAWKILADGLSEESDAHRKDAERWRGLAEECASRLTGLVNVIKDIRHELEEMQAVHVAGADIWPHWNNAHILALDAVGIESTEERAEREAAVTTGTSRTLDRGPIEAQPAPPGWLPDPDDLGPVDESDHDDLERARMQALAQRVRIAKGQRDQTVEKAVRELEGAHNRLMAAAAMRWNVGDKIVAVEFENEARRLFEAAESLKPELPSEEKP